MWIRISAGLYLLNRNTGEYQHIEMEIGITYIIPLSGVDNGLLYIGQMVWEHLSIITQDKTFEHYFLIILL